MDRNDVGYKCLMEALELPIPEHLNTDEFRVFWRHWVYQNQGPAAAEILALLSQFDEPTALFILRCSRNSGVLEINFAELLFRGYRSQPRPAEGEFHGHYQPVSIFRKSSALHELARNVENHREG